MLSIVYKNISKKIKLNQVNPAIIKIIAKDNLTFLEITIIDLFIE